jgi:hypothetical protein
MLQGRQLVLAGTREPDDEKPTGEAVRCRAKVSARRLITAL